jgi:hypothetical protein
MSLAIASQHFPGTNAVMHWKLSGYECPPNHGTHHAPRTTHPWYVLHSALQTLLVSASLRRVEIVRRQSLLIPSFVIMYKAAQGYLDTTLPTALILLGP